MRRIRKRVDVIVVCLCATLQMAGAAHAQQAGSFLKTVEAIAGGADASGRRAAITNRLDAIGVKYGLEEFSAREQKGLNIVASIPARIQSTAEKTILLGAHYDRVARGTGAVDNGSSCAVLLELLSAMTAKPLENYNLAVVFFDLEELGLLGSRAYLEGLRTKGSLPRFAANMDIFAYGDTLYVIASQPEGPLALALDQSAKQSGVSLRFSAEYPGSDHRSMIAAGIETLGITLIDGPEIDSIVSVVRRMPGAAAPPVLRLIHTDGDVIDKVRAEDVVKAIPVLERFVRSVDEKN